MKICIYGAGATGGHFAVKLAQSGHEVGVVARGTHLAAIQANGLTLHTGDRVLKARVAASDDPVALGVQDVVLVAVKATGLAAVADGLASLVGPRTLVAFPQNGINWWYRLGLNAGRPAPPNLPIFGLADRFLAHLDIDRIVGGSILSANEVIEPGVILNSSPNRNMLTLGAIAPGRDSEIVALRAILEAAGITSPTVADIRRTIWSKLLINLGSSTIAVAIENRSSICRTDPALGETFRRLVREGLAIAAAHGYVLDEIDPERLIAALPEHKPSLLQDFEQRRPMEIAEIIEAPLAFARTAGVETPTLDALAAIVICRARDRGLLT